MNFLSRHVKVLSVALSAVAATVALISCQTVRWKLVKSKLHHEFATVAEISTGQLSAWINDPNRPPPVLFDVRTKPEYDISHLAHAIHIEPGTDPAALKLSTDQPIVTYCSVGYRSSAFARKLDEAGFKNVVNLDGSIFQWANEGRPLFHGGEPTNQVHPFNTLWGTLLDQSHRTNVTTRAKLIR